MKLNRTLRIALLLLCLAASTAQSWVAQVHAHYGHAEAARAVGADHAGAQAHAARTGSDAAELGCLLCQVAAQASVPLANASAPALVLPLAFARLASAQPSLSPSRSPSHHWSSRGPPGA